MTVERLVAMMGPCKNMHHLNGKTVPLIIGAGGVFIHAVAEMNNLLRVDPVDAARANSMPMLRLTKADGSRAPLTVEVIRNWAKTLAISVGQDPAHFGAHSLRIHECHHDCLSGFHVSAAGAAEHRLPSVLACILC